MNFNEKLMNLRKKEGLSQEELAEKLNVTRQTISKWELGQTTPDMDKLSEIAKTFQVSVDELLSEKEINGKEVEPIKNDDEQKTSKRNGTIVVILIIVLVCALVTGGYLIISKKFGPIFEIKKQGQEMINDIMSITKEEIKREKDELYNKENKKQNEEIKIEENNKDIKISIHNYEFENLYTGKINSLFIKQAINEVIRINQTDDNKIFVKYNEIDTQDINEISKVSLELEDNKEYLVTYDYDEEGYICKMDISDI